MFSLSKNELFKMQKHTFGWYKGEKSNKRGQSMENQQFILPIVLLFLTRCQRHRHFYTATQVWRLSRKTAQPPLIKLFQLCLIRILHKIWDIAQSCIKKTTNSYSFSLSSCFVLCMNNPYIFLYGDYSRLHG